jgi:hypothetical protein
MRSEEDGNIRDLGIFRRNAAAKFRRQFLEADETQTVAEGALLVLLPPEARRRNFRVAKIVASSGAASAPLLTSLIS